MLLMISLLWWHFDSWWWSGSATGIKATHSICDFRRYGPQWWGRDEPYSSSHPCRLFISINGLHITWGQSSITRSSHMSNEWRRTTCTTATYYSHLLHILARSISGRSLHGHVIGIFRSRSSYSSCLGVQVKWNWFPYRVRPGSNSFLCPTMVLSGLRCRLMWSNGALYTRGKTFLNQQLAVD